MVQGKFKLQHDLLINNCTVQICSVDDMEILFSFHLQSAASKIETKWRLWYHCWGTRFTAQHHNWPPPTTKWPCFALKSITSETSRQNLMKLHGKLLMVILFKKIPQGILIDQQQQQMACICPKSISVFTRSLHRWPYTNNDLGVKISNKWLP